MGFKKMDRNLSFAEYSLMGTLEKNRAVERLDKINSLVNWERVEEIITAGYPVGKTDRLHHDDHPLVPLRRSGSGLITAITEWLYSADH